LNLPRLELFFTIWGEDLDAQNANSPFGLVCACIGFMGLLSLFPHSVKQVTMFNFATIPSMTPTREYQPAPVL